MSLQDRRCFPHVLHTPVCTGSDDNLIDLDRLHCFYLIDSLCISRKVRERDRRTYFGEIDGDHFIILRILIRLVDRVRLFGVLFHVGFRFLIHREDSVLCACFDRHIRHRIAVVHGQVRNPVTGKLHGFIKCAIHADLSDDMDDNIFSAYIFPRLSCQHELDRTWNFEPDLSGRHSCRNVCRSHSCRERAEGSVCTGVGICSDDTFSRNDNARLRKDCVLHTRFSLFKIPCQPLLFRIFADRLGVLG